MSIAWRFAALGGTTAGLLLSPALPAGSADLALPMLALAAAGAFGLAAARPAGDPSSRGIWLALIALVAATAGGAGGALRLAAIDAGALESPVGGRATARGFVTAVSSRSSGEVRVRVKTPDGRLAIEAPEPVPDLPIGRQISAAGTLREPQPWEAAYLARNGISRVLIADRLRLTGVRRGGLMGTIDAVRDRAEAALGSGTPEPEAELLRGFVLGEDDRIDPATVDDFKRSGLAHLLAVSGQNVILLALLAIPVLALLGVPHRPRLVCVLVLIAIYVPVTGAGPSIQRAGVMGAAGVVAALAGRPRSRWYALLLAGAVTLAVNPRASDDPGWQLSFAAVVGILLWAGPIRGLLLGPLDDRREPVRSAWRRALAEGAGMTIAATLATAPLMAHHFEGVSLASLPANLLVLPAVGPVMWLGMLSAFGGQLPWIPTEPLTGVAGLLAAYVAQVAHWLAAPSWARVSVSLPGPAGVAASYVLMGAAFSLLLVCARRRRGLRSLWPRIRALAVVCAACVAVPVALSLHGDPLPDADPGLRVTVLDVGQGDAILFTPADGEPVLVDGGPPGDGLRDQLRSEGISSLAAAIVTHDQSDHAGGVEELLGAFPIRRLIYAEPGGFLRQARAAGVPAMEIAEGSEVDSGSLRIETLWPPRSLLDGPPPADLNQAALVLLARWRGFEMLLTADAEAEAVPIDPGPVDVLKVAHHGSADTGLDALLDRTVPRLAVISVGADNPYGHPDPRTLSILAAHRIPALRTDEGGDVVIDVSRAGWRVEGKAEGPAESTAAAGAANTLDARGRPQYQSQRDQARVPDRRHRRGKDRRRACAIAGPGRAGGGPRRPGELRACRRSGTSRSRRFGGGHSRALPHRSAALPAGRRHRAVVGAAGGGGQRRHRRPPPRPDRGPRRA
jgi:competence protein ComEC